MSAPRAARMRKIGMAALVVAASGGIANASPACSIVAGNRTVVVTGLSPSAVGQLCMTTVDGWRCRKIRADTSGLVVANAGAALKGPIWMIEAAKQNAPPTPPCIFLTPAQPDELRPLIIALLSALAAFLTGMSAAIIPRWIDRRQHSREAATAWVGEYLWRLSAFEKNGGTDADPRPLPQLCRRDASQLSVISTEAGTFLGNAGYLRASTEQERRQLVAPIVAALRRYPRL